MANETWRETILTREHFGFYLLIVSVRAQFIEFQLELF